MRKNKHDKQTKGDNRLREMITREAARLMYEGDVSQYYSAKWLAAKAILNRGGRKTRSIRTRDLPSNGEISNAVYEMVKLYEGDSIDYRLFSMRVAALELMQQLYGFSPRLIGSVSTGKIKRNSDIDLHVFTDSIETLHMHLQQIGLHFETKQVCIMVSGRVKAFTHFYLDHEFPVELSVYPENDIRIRGRSSTDGKPIIRLSYTRLLALIESEHGEAWAQYIQRGEI